MSEPAYITVVETRPFIEDASRIPLFLLTAYSKSQQTDLTPAQRAAMRRVGAAIVSQYTAMPLTHRSRRSDE